MSGLGSIGASLGSGNEPGGQALGGAAGLGSIGTPVNTGIASPQIVLPTAPPAFIQQDNALAAGRPGQTPFQRIAPEVELQEYWTGRARTGNKLADNILSEDRGRRIPDIQIHNGILTVPSNHPGIHEDLFPKGYEVVMRDPNAIQRVLGFNNQQSEQSGQPRYFAEGGIIEEVARQSAGDEPEMSPEDPVVNEAIMALDPEGPMMDIADKQEALGRLEEKYGPGAVEELMELLEPEEQSDDGLSDTIPAEVETSQGREKAALSVGEFVVPADVVSGLGNGSTEAGAEKLQGLMAAIRQERTGSPQAAPKVNSEGILGLVKGDK